MTEYTNSFKGHYYMKFVVEKLKPFIDANYRTLPGANHTATGGSSAGGLISFMLLWEHNNVFSKAACISPPSKSGCWTMSFPSSILPVKKNLDFI
jgi:predicted alpha/beta superfamily hydrolase